MKMNWSTVKYGLAAVLLMVCVVAAIIFNGLQKDQNLRANLLLNGVRTSGKIADMHGSRGSKNQIDMEFRAVDGRSVKTTYYCALRCPEKGLITKGMRVDVVYDTVNPMNAIPAPYKTVPQRDVVSEVFAFLRLLCLVVLAGSPLILGLAFLRSRSSGSRKL